MTPALGLARSAGGGSFLCRVGGRGRSRPRLAGGYNLGGIQKQLVLIDALPFRSVTLAQQLLQLALYTFQEPVLVLHQLQQLKHHLAQGGCLLG